MFLRGVCRYARMATAFIVACCLWASVAMAALLRQEYNEAKRATPQNGLPLSLRRNIPRLQRKAVVFRQPW